MRYQGQREGSRHKRTKELICRIIGSDSGFSTPQVEKRWNSFNEGWRKPDVATNWNGLPVVFEAQVSNTYPGVVAERTEFYRNQGALLVWIFDRLPDGDWQTLHADTFCANNQLILIADEQAAFESEAAGVAKFSSYALIPEVEPHVSSGYTLLRPYQREMRHLVAFHELALDVRSQSASLFSVKAASGAAEHKVLCSRTQASQRHEGLEEALRSLLKLDAPISRQNVMGWAALVCAIESARLASPIGTRLADPIGVLNLVYDHHPAFFGHLIATLDRLDIGIPKSRSGAMARRVAEFRGGRYKGSELPPAHKGSLKLLPWLYPNAHDNREAGLAVELASTVEVPQVRRGRKELAWNMDPSNPRPADEYCVKVENAEANGGSGVANYRVFQSDDLLWWKTTNGLWWLVLSEVHAVRVYRMKLPNGEDAANIEVKLKNFTRPWATTTTAWSDRKMLSSGAGTAKAYQVIESLKRLNSDELPGPDECLQQIRRELLAAGYRVNDLIL